MNNKRIEQLDSLRGLAACTVLLCHLIIVKESTFTFVMRTPLRLFNNGHAAVMLFFVLSGFVLSLPFLKSKVNYSSYLTKRIFRIYFPYVVAVTVSMIASTVFYQHQIAGLSGWFNGSWTNLPDLNLIGEHLVMIGNIHTEDFNKVIWSLVQEMRISLIFPLLVLIVKRFDYKISLAFCLLCSVIAATNNLYHFQTSYGLNTNYFETLAYIPLFMLGSYLAKHKGRIVDLFNTFGTIGKAALVLLALATYSFSESIIPKILNLGLLKPFQSMIQDYCIGLGAAIFLIFALGSSKAVHILAIKPIVFLGKISYSLYLYHLIVILACVHLLYDILPLWSILGVSVVMSVAVSFLSWKYVEEPCNRAGRMLAQYINKKKVIMIHHRLKGGVR
jgi:peptidoglycan/LPS O-acetylase OafA/YrhL